MWGPTQTHQGLSPVNRAGKVGPLLNLIELPVFPRSIVFPVNTGVQRTEAVFSVTPEVFQLETTLIHAVFVRLENTRLTRGHHHAQLDAGMVSFLQQLENRHFSRTRAHPVLATSTRPVGASPSQIVPVRPASLELQVALANPAPPAPTSRTRALPPRARRARLPDSGHRRRAWTRRTA